ncbi:cell division protein FtsZ protein 1, chloroplastic [Trifolium repens]|nr:cell division protein FtsZ protein 1, chloroplastic [Trifolium repens]
MVQEAEKYKAEDEEHKKNVEAKIALEQEVERCKPFCFPKDAPDQHSEAQVEHDTCHDPITLASLSSSLQSFPSRNSGYYFNSTKVASQNITKGLKDDDCYVIGLYGKRGCGKTALVKAKMEEYEKIFHRVIFHPVSENQDIKSIQVGISRYLNVFDKDDSDGARIVKIISALEKKDRTTLVILDNFPSKSKLEELGIPYNSKQYKFLLTAREETDCTIMGCDHLIHLKPLSDEEAFTLLHKLSGVESQTDLFKLVRDVAFKCNGLPGLIKDVAFSLKKKPIEKWEESLVSLSHSTAQYQIFISFRGKDTRDIFTNHLYEALCKEGFETFKDDKALEGGTPIDKLLEAIEESRFAIVVLSENFADSKWCLKELVKILDCRKRKKQLVLPIFYEVEPTDIRNLKGRYGEAMAEQEKELGKDSKMVLEWTLALNDISRLKGEHFRISNFKGEHYERYAIKNLSSRNKIPGLVNVDFANVKSVMKDSGTAMLGVGVSSGKNRAEEAAEQATLAPLIGSSIQSATGVVYNITGGKDITLQEVNRVSQVVTSLADPSANIIFGAVVDDRYTGEIHVTIIATGFSQSFQKKLLTDPRAAKLLDKVVERKESCLQLSLVLFCSSPVLKSSNLSSKVESKAPHQPKLFV